MFKSQRFSLRRERVNPRIAPKLRQFFDWRRCAPIRGLEVAATLTLLLWWLATPPAGAQGLTLRLQPDAAVTPSRNAAYFDYLVSPGDQFSDVLLLTNAGAAPLTLVVYAADGATAINGGLAFPAGPDDRPSQAGAWLTLEERSLTLQPGETRRVTFHVAIPLDVTHQQAAGLTAQPAATPLPSPGQLGVAVVQRVAVTVLFTLRQAQTAQLSVVELANAADAEQAIVARLHNTGAIGFTAEGTLTLGPADGDAVWRILPVRVGFVLPGDRIELPLLVEPPLPAGVYAATLTLSYADQTTQATTVITLAGPVTLVGEAGASPASEPIVSIPTQPVLPTWLVGAAGAVILLLVGVVMWQAIRLRRAGS